MSLEQILIQFAPRILTQDFFKPLQLSDKVFISPSHLIGKGTRLILKPVMPTAYEKIH